jgi:hypothetical protein
MSEQVTPLVAAQASKEPEVDAELEQAREEVLRLRDLLIAKDAELGAAKGRVAELEDHRMRLAGVKHRIASQIPGLRLLLGAVLRLMRGQR